jgi:hypothetical protein
MLRAFQLLIVLGLLFTAASAFAAEERHGMLPAAPYSYQGRVAVVVGQPTAIVTRCHLEALLYPVVIINPRGGPAFITGLIVPAADELPQGSRWDIHQSEPCADHEGAHDHVHVHLVRR